MKCPFRKTMHTSTMYTGPNKYTNDSQTEIESEEHFCECYGKECAAFRLNNECKLVDHKPSVA